jgi:hypothetical protein
MDSLQYDSLIFYKLATKKMKIKSVLVLCLNLVFCAFFTQAQNNNISRKILHTLAENEILHYDEAIVHTDAQISNFCMIIEDTIKSTNTFVYNGNKILEIKSNDWLTINTGSIDLSNQNGFVLDYTIDEKQYVNLFGTVYGPYDMAKSLYCSKTKEIGIYYKLGDKYYFKVKNQKFGPFSADHNSINLFDSKRIFKIEYEDHFTAVVSGNDYLEIVDEKQLQLNGKVLNADHYDMTTIFSLAYFSKDKFGYLSGKFSNKSCDVWINGQIIDSYEITPYSGDKLILTNQDFYFTSNYTNKIYKNGSPIYNDVTFIYEYNDKGDFMYQTTDNKMYLNNKSLFSNSEASFSQASFLSLDQYAFSYSLNDEYFVLSSQGNYGPYNYVNYLKYNDFGKLKFNFYKDEVVFTFDNGQISTKKDSPDFYSAYGNQSLKYKGHAFESSYNYDYVVIDGEPYGKASALQVWIDSQNNSLNWTSLENNEYVIYSFSIQ